MYTYPSKAENAQQLSIQQVEEIVSVLKPIQQQLLKDVILYGSWGDGDMSFLNDNGEIETDYMFGYFTDYDKRAKNEITGRARGAQFRSIYKKLCSECKNQIGRWISHCNDWWGDGTGNMLFIRGNAVQAFEEWAKQ